ncbi:hypothetical protein A3A40_03595 [Candidatus Kaiserbacteria bacterium RIFCSPLOWO2_01_FULL_54_20]|uniref:Uncharacterized protein n=1 Tax=Candidatus Kaiserbacteria bacterium RIFCSPLOWO2_01_FULL_54_20 TaxID=1798513 RepID=A0A1F6EK95_9BACT|nr:MAG: hypothetical protein A3A40_03595 [Candidatus Kaiserbacteria bacterium RIFCSPLOWO2_01_FULL_54_20]
MLTNKDIDSLMRVFPTKEDVRRIVQEEVADIRKSVRDLVNGIDKLVTAFSELGLKYAAMGEQLTRPERWIKQIAKKAGVALAD